MHVLLDDEEVRLKQSGQSTDDGAGGVSESLAEVLNKDHDRMSVNPRLLINLQC